MITCYFEKSNKKEFLRHVTVDALIVENNKILLVKRAGFLLEGNKYAVPGGFLERNETAFQAVSREAEEETGYKVEITSLFRINDKPKRKGDDRQNVAFVFLAKPKKRVSRPDKETESIAWFDLDKLPKPEKIAFDHLENISLYLKYRKKKFPLPIIG